MTEYWVSKKQYWCKYCSIYIRDDAPSRRQHETGLRHIGAKERFIRDLYKTGNIAKRDKEQEAQEMARIDAAAQAAHAQDTGVAGPSRKSLLYTLNHASPAASASGPKRLAKPVDKFANYSTAAQLGLAKEETPTSSYEVEQMVRNRDTKVGQWEEVINEPTGLHSAPGASPVDDDEEGEGWKFQHKGKRPVRDPYDDDDFDPSSVLKMRKKAKPEDKSATTPIPTAVPPIEKRDTKGNLDRGAWEGRIELNGALGSKDGLVYQAGGGWVKRENAEDDASAVDDKPDPTEPTDSTPAALKEDNDVKPDTSSEAPVIEAILEDKPLVPDDQVVLEAKSASTPSSAEPASGGLFKKRRPPPSARKK